MKADVFYNTLLGRIIFKILERTGVLCLFSWFLKTRMSSALIPGYIKRYGIDMEPYAGQNYRSFAEFFSRKRSDNGFVNDPNTLISPCDGLLSVYAISKNQVVSVKGSEYTLEELLPDNEITNRFKGGFCLIFRLEATDYHHFCCFDDGTIIEKGFIPGRLNSVQPVAQRTVPVFRINRRWWSILETAHFGTALQIEVGAVLVGGVSLFVGNNWFRRGDDMGCFELSGSTVILMLNSRIKKKLMLNDNIILAIAADEEIRVRSGESIGVLNNG